MMDFTATFSPASLAAIGQMFSFDIFLEEEVGVAMGKAGDLVAAAAVANTWAVFSNPSGQLASTIVPLQTSPFEVQITVGSPYGMRREKGFTGLTDSLGRYFSNDPAKPYAQPALDDNQQEVLMLVDEGVALALARIGGA